MPSNSIRVVNSAGKTVSRTNMKRASRMVGRGIARWRGAAVEMISGDHRCSPLAQIRFTDGAGMASIDAIKGLPVAGDVIRLLMGRPATGSGTRVLVSVGPISSVDMPAKVPLWKGVPLLETRTR